ncbi:MAG: hypothetical protein HUU20_17230 [Pirellulales bacterium]|nr:hypothetical protein [Pirellulales bacterium]
MPTAPAARNLDQPAVVPLPEPSAPSPAAVAVAVAGMAISWAAAGSIGLVAQPFRIAIVWVGLVVLGVVLWPRRSGRWKQHALLAAAIALALVLLAAAAVPGILGIALVVAAFARSKESIDRRLLTLTAVAAAALGAYRLTLASVPALWSLADLLGAALGRTAAAVSGRPLSIGATFAGLDLLVVMAVVYLGWLRLTAPPRRRRALVAGTAILASHLIYLLLLASAADLAAALPITPPADQDPYLDFYIPPETHWTEAAGKALPWNLPLVAAVFDLAIAAAMFRRARWLPAGRVDSPGRFTIPIRFRPALDHAPLALALVTPIVVALAPGAADLKDRKIVVLDEGYLDWEKPAFDQYGEESAGMYGMLPAFVESLGGSLVRSADLAEDDLRNASVLVVFHPNRMWPDEQCRRVWQFVRAGGSLLLVAGPSIPEDRMGATVNQVLQPTSMEIRFDTAAASAPYWHGVLTVMAHPATSGIGGNHNRFGLLLGPSIRAGWPARPLLVGRYGWSDPGCDAALNMSYRFDAGERLGDLVLAAEQRLGKGTVIVLADPFCLTNEGNPAAFEFTGRLLGYLANRPSNPQTAWRQAVGLLACGLLVGLLVWQCHPGRTAAASVAMSIALLAVDGVNGLRDVCPEGRPGQAVPVAYIDGSHLEAYSGERWGFDDMAGLKLTLLRNGYLPLVAPDLKPQRLTRAAMLISIAPAREFSEIERQSVRDFVEQGGIFISMAGAEDAGPSRRLLADFGFRVPPPTLLPPPDASEPRHERNFRSRYLDAEATGGPDCYVGFHAAWPIEFSGPDTVPVVADFDNRSIVAVRAAGAGKVVVIGDTGFAMNKNLEYVGGQPFAAGYENAHFWRWFLGFLNERPAWIPPPPPPPKPDDSPPKSEPPDAAKGREVSP